MKEKYWMREWWWKDPSFIPVRKKCNIDLLANIIINKETGDEINNITELIKNCRSCLTVRKCTEFALYFNLLDKKRDEQIWKL